MNYYEEIKNQIIDNEVFSKVKDYSKEKHKINKYFEIGKLLDRADNEYGKGIIKEYSRKLTEEFGKKYTTSLLYKIKQFYNILEKVPTLSGKLTWSHWYEMLPIKNMEKIKYYVSKCEINSYDVRTLRNKIKSNEYERLSIETKNKLTQQEQLEAKDLIPNPILIKNTDSINIINEKILKQLILEDIDNFLLELGNDFSYIGNEYKIKLGDRYNYIDLLLYNIGFNCYVVIELKITELKKEHIGQIEIYMNYIDSNLKKINQDKTIGIIICKKENKFVMEYCSDDRILAREYKLI